VPVWQFDLHCNPKIGGFSGLPLLCTVHVELEIIPLAKGSDRFPAWLAPIIGPTQEPGLLRGILADRGVDNYGERVLFSFAERDINGFDVRATEFE